MPRFHFNIHDGFTRPDARGKDLPDLTAARHEAMRQADIILETDADRVSLGEVWYMEVTDDRGRLLFKLDFHDKFYSKPKPAENERGHAPSQSPPAATLVPTPPNDP